MLSLTVGLACCGSEWLTNDPPDELLEFIPDKAPGSKNAYISAFSGDDDIGHYYLLSLVSGYNLMKVDPSKDRILLVPNKSFLTKHQLSLLKKVWTHIIVREYIAWPSGRHMKSSTDKNLWFKLNAWTVGGYKKLFWTGTDVLFLKNPGIVFKWPAPASSLDFHVWNMSRYGPVTNGDCFLLSPSTSDFDGLVKMAAKTIDHPLNHINDTDFYGEGWIGPFDNGLLIEYFRGGITVLPEWFQYELPGNRLSLYKNWWDLKLDDRVLSLHYPVGFKPWRKYLREFTDAWTEEAIEACKYLGFDLDFDKYGLHQPGSVNLETVICEHCKEMSHVMTVSPVKGLSFVASLAFLLLG